MLKKIITPLTVEGWQVNEPAVQNFVQIKPYNLHELCQLYGTSYKTFKRWIDPLLPQLGSKNGRYFSILQVEKIFIFLGVPYQLVEEL